MWLRLTKSAFIGGSWLLAALNALNSQSIDRVLVTGPNCQYPTRFGVDLTVDQPEATGWAAWYVELDAGEAGQVAAHVSCPEELAGDPSVRQVVECGASGSRHLRSVDGKCG